MSQKVLIVDDDDELVQTLKMRFDYEGFLSVTANSGKEALEKAQSENPDAIILDLVLPNESGVHVLEKLNAMNLVGQIKIVALSGVDDPEVRAKVLDLGADVFFPKPCDLAVLVERVKSLL